MCFDGVCHVYLLQMEIVASSQEFTTIYRVKPLLSRDPRAQCNGSYETVSRISREYATDGSEIEAGVRGTHEMF